MTHGMVPHSMTMWPLESSSEIYISSQSSLDSETAENSHISRHGCQMTHGVVPYGMTMWMPLGKLRGGHMA